MNLNEQIEFFKRIGKSEYISEEDFNIALPNYPILRGSEIPITIAQVKFSVAQYSNNDLEFLIKGLHVVETLYKKKQQDDFGFGSPSASYKIISSLSKKNNKLAKELTEWIANRGGNYYIKRND